MLLQNFDDVLTPKDHVSRNPNDTYYVDKDTVCLLQHPLEQHLIAAQLSQSIATLLAGLPTA